MKISSITVFQIDLPLIEGQYNWSNDNSVSVFDSTVVAIGTDAGLDGMFHASDKPGLGVEPVPDVFGKPLLTITQNGIVT